jgi:isoleucyl-tRNA synthetase
VVQAEAVNFAKKDIEIIQRTMFGTLWNVRAFYLMYAGTETIEMEKPRSGQVLDRWLMARLHELMRDMTESMNGYDLVAAIRPLKLWIEDLSTWWLRRSRERMKRTDAYDKHDALRTLREALLETARLMAPFAPFISERLYQDLGGSKMSVHLDRWPKADERLIDEQLIADMAAIRNVVALGHEARVVAKMPVRQALAGADVAFRDVTIAAHLNQKPDLLGLITDELNVEKVTVHGGEETGEEPWRVVLDTVLTPELKKKGMARELARHVMNIRKGLHLTPQDTIRITAATEDPGMRDLLEELLSLIAGDVKAERVEVLTELSENSDQAVEITLDERACRVLVIRAE